MSADGFSVVIPTLNRGDYLKQCVRDLLRQEYRPFEVVIVDQLDKEDAALQELLTAHPEQLRHIRLDKRGLPYARNLGWQAARYSRVLFVDDDVRCPPDLLAQHARALALPGVGVVGGGIDEPSRPERGSGRPGVFNWWSGIPSRHFSARSEGDADHAPGGNFSVWRHLLQAVGGFDEQLAVGAGIYEETEFCLRLRAAGCRIYFNGHARLTHLVAPAGGCRVPEPRRYVQGHAHNRAILVTRHLRGVRALTALLRTTALAMSYSRYHRDPRLFVAYMTSYARSVAVGRKAPICTPLTVSSSRE